MIILREVWEYLRMRQSTKIRFLHLVVLLAVISQIIASNFIEFTKNGEIVGKPIDFYGTWIHILTGMVLLPVAIVFTFLLLKEHGFKYFFPYLFGTFEQVKNDIDTLKRLELPEPDDGGLATIVQGLGLGALFLALLSGLAWFIAWKYNIPWSHSIKELHESLVGLIEFYIIGHGGMGLMHIYLTLRHKQQGYR